MIQLTGSRHATFNPTGDEVGFEEGLTPGVGLLSLEGDALPGVVAVGLTEATVPRVLHAVRTTRARTMYFLTLVLTTSSRLSYNLP